MTATDNEALIREYFDVVTGVSSSRPLPDFFADDVTWTVPQSNPNQPNPRVGLEAVMDLLTSGVGIYEPGSMKLTLGHVISGEAKVAAQFTLDARLTNGTPYSNHYVFIFTLTQGRITGVWEYLDTLYQDRLGTFQ